MSADISGVSRSGRVRKKSAKLIEMEEMEKTDLNGVGNKSSRNISNHNSVMTSGLSNGSGPEFASIKKKIKIRFSTDNGTGMEEMPIENSFDERSLAIDNTPTVPSLKIKLFQNSHGMFAFFCNFYYILISRLKMVDFLSIFKQTILSPLLHGKFHLNSIIRKRKTADC